MLRNASSVVVGYLVMALIVMLGTMALVASLVPGGIAAMRNRDASTAPTPSMRYYALNVLLSFFAAVVGGVAAARIAGPASKPAIIALGAVVLVLGIVSGVTARRGTQPRWYQVLIPLVGVAGIAASRVV